MVKSGRWEIGGKKKWEVGDWMKNEHFGRWEVTKWEVGDYKVGDEKLCAELIKIV